MTGRIDRRVVRVAAAVVVTALAVIGIGLATAPLPSTTAPVATASAVATTGPRRSTAPVATSAPAGAARVDSRPVPIGPMAAGRYHIDVDLTRSTLGLASDRLQELGARVSFDVPAGWSGSGDAGAASGTAVHKGDAAPIGGLSMAPWSIEYVYLDPCHAAGAEARNDIVRAPSIYRMFRPDGSLWELWADDTSLPPHAGFAPTSPTTTKPVEVTLAGLDGRYVAVRTPADLDIDACDGGTYALWQGADGLKRRVLHPGQLDRLWIVDVDGFGFAGLEGGLVVIDASSQAGASPEDLAELQAIVDTIEIDARRTGVSPDELAELQAVADATHTGPGRNGWIAFARADAVRGADGVYPGGGPPDRDIYLLKEDRAARQIIGTDTDGVDQACPAFSADGTRLAYDQRHDESDTPWLHQLEIAELDDDTAVSFTSVVLGSDVDPLCAIWSPDSRRIAVPVGTQPSDGRPPDGGQVWVVALDGGPFGGLIPDMLASDLEWSPDGSMLAIAEAHPGGYFATGDERLYLYAVATGELTTLDVPPGVQSLSWSPDGRRIAYQRVRGAGTRSGEGGMLGGSQTQEILVVSVDGSEQALQTAPFEAIHGVGPVWSPGGDVIAYQRICATHPSDPSRPCREQHEVVILAPGAEANAREPVGHEEVVPPVRLNGADGPAFWFPWRVTWSPDGTRLLYEAWNELVPSATPASTPPLEQVGLIVVPIDRSARPTLLYEGRDISGSASWGREPGD